MRCFSTWGSRDPCKALWRCAAARAAALQSLPVLLGGSCSVLALQQALHAGCEVAELLLDGGVLLLVQQVLVPQQQVHTVLTSLFSSRGWIGWTAEHECISTRSTYDTPTPCSFWPTFLGKPPPTCHLCQASHVVRQGLCETRQG